MEFREAVAELDVLVRALEADGDARAARVLELVDAIHRPALERLAAGKADDPIVQALLAMYGLVPMDERMVVEAALDAARAGGARIELVSVENGVVEVRLSGSTEVAVEEALRAGYADFRRVVVVGEPRVVSIPFAAPDYVEVEDVEPGMMKLVDVRGVPVLLAGVDGEVYAFRNECAVDRMPLDGGRLADTVIVCPWHNCAYDARTGERVDGEGHRLRVVPVRRHDGGLQVAV